MFIRLCGILFGFFLQQALFAASNPITVTATSSSRIPPLTAEGGSYVVTYTVTSYLPMTMPTPFNNSQKAMPTNEFTFADGCQGKQLAQFKSCTISIGLNARKAGRKSATLYLTYGHNTIPISVTTVASSEVLNSSWNGLIGVDYNPDHYANTNVLNNHDVYYVGMNGSSPITNVYAELVQLKAAGFTTVRSYQTVPYAWIDIIKQASALGLKVVYEASIPENGSQTDINAAVSVLNAVINAVGASTFQQTVTLVFAGHENYNGANVMYLTTAVSNLQTALQTAGISNVPVGSAVLAGNFVTPSPAISADMNTLIKSYSSSAPLAFDPYPFQYGVMPPNQAVTNVTLTNAISWDYAQTMSQTFYVPPRTILMAETGWATSGVGTYAGYFCAISPNVCSPSIANAAAYLTALYQSVKQPGNNSGVLVFEAYDEPAKDPAHADDAENHYGVLTSDCELKSVNLLPNTSFVIANFLGCKGFVSGTLLSVVGGSVTNQPPFTVSITQTNPTTSVSASMNVSVATQDRSNAAVKGWPYFLVFNAASVTITGSATGNACTVSVSVAANQATTFGAVTCTGASVVNCNNGSSACFLPPSF